MMNFINFPAITIKYLMKMTQCMRFCKETAQCYTIYVKTQKDSAPCVD